MCAAKESESMQEEIENKTIFLVISTTKPFAWTVINAVRACLQNWIKPNLLQMHSSYVLTDPKGYTWVG